MDFDPCESWYHGSPLQLSVLRKGSTITRKRDLARILSHKPTIVSVGDTGCIKHDGKVPGYLYVIMEEVKPDDVIPHPHSTMQPGDEWLTTRDLQINKIGFTRIVPGEQLTDEELAELIKHSRDPRP